MSSFHRFSRGVLREEEEEEDQEIYKEKNEAFRLLFVLEDGFCFLPVFRVTNKP